MVTKQKDSWKQKQAEGNKAKEEVDKKEDWWIQFEILR